MYADSNPVPPRIAMTTWRRRLDTPVLGAQDLTTLGADYIRAVQNAGGISLLLPHAMPEHAEVALDGVSGVVLVGGGDVDPASYGCATDGRSVDVDPAADRFEIAVCRAALRRGLPILAICRGMQLLNVVLGGTLFEDVRDLTPSPHQVAGPSATEVLSFRHEVKTEPASLLHRLYGERIPVNSLHHQCVRRLGRGLDTAARSADGLCEAVEFSAGSTLHAVGVQWHPEKLAGGQALFDWLVGAARAHA